MTQVSAGGITGLPMIAACDRIVGGLLQSIEDRPVREQRLLLRNNARRIGRVVIARGRDAMDVAMVTSFGKLLLEQMTVWADEIIPATATPDDRLR